MAYLSPSFRYPALSKYHCDNGRIHRCNHGRFMMKGASEGVDMMGGAAEGRTVVGER